MSNVSFVIQRYLGGWRWVLVHQNGNELATSHTYSRKRDVKRALRTLTSVNLANANVREETDY